MKKLFIFSFLIVLWVSQLQAQTPHAMKYQTVIRNNAGEALANKLVAIRASILSGSTSGTMVYQEVHNIATNEFGIANLNIGEGTVQSGIFNNIVWGNASHFLKIEIDIANGSNFSFMGTSQLLSVPYALYAEKSANAIDDFDKDSTNELQNIQKTGNTVTLNKNGGSFTDSDIQQLSINGNNVSITNGNTIALPADYDKDSTNEIQTISKNGNNISLSKNGGNVTDSDNQTLNIVGNQLQISNGNSVTLTGAVDLDADPTNELQTISKSGDTIKLSKNGGNILLPNEHTLSSTANGTNRTINITGGTGTTINIADNDNDTTNELQTITKVGNTITLNKNGGSFTESDNQNLSYTSSGTQRTVNISNGTGITLDVADKDNDSINELQTLSYSNDTLYLSKGNYAVFPFSKIMPQGSCINSLDANPPQGYTYSGNFYESWDQPWSLYKTVVDTFNYPTGSYCIIKVNNIIYMIGGYIPGSMTSESSKKVFAYDIINETWTEKAQLNQNNSYRSAIYCNNKIYCFTYNGDAMEEYNIATNTWSVKAGISQIGTPRFISVNNKIYCFGINNPSNPPELIVYEYNPTTNTWQSLQTYTPCNSYSKPKSYGSKIYLNASYTNFGGYSNLMLEYNTITNQFFLNGTSSMGDNSIIKDSILYCTEGGGSNGLNFKNYNLNTNTWNDLGSINSGNGYSGQLFYNKNILYNFNSSECHSVNTSFKKVEIIERLFTNPQPAYFFEYNNYFYAIQTISSSGQKPNIYKYKPKETFYIHCKN